MDQILLDIAALSPIIAILIAIIWWLNKQLKNRELEISELHSELREIERDSLVGLVGLSRLVDEAVIKGSTNYDKLSSEIAQLKESILNKLNQ